MESYIGTKIVNAEPAKQYEVKSNPGFPGLGEDGYRVVYEDGYTSWSPKDVFERSYRKITEAEKKMI